MTERVQAERIRHAVSVREMTFALIIIERSLGNIFDSYDRCKFCERIKGTTHTEGCKGARALEIAARVYREQSA